MKKILFLILIVLIGFAFRFYDLGATPNSLNWDEVSWGYNAYSILTTGRDEHGEILPLSFKAFGDYKQPAYVYLDVVAIKIFGLTPFAVRFPSALFGTLSILSIYFLTREFFAKDKRREAIALFSALLFAISPWSIQFSRVAYEANVAVFFILTGAVSLLVGARKGNLLLSTLGVILLGISTYSYHSAKLFTPLLFIALIAFCWLRFKISKKLIAILLLIFFLITISWVIDSRTTARGRSVTFTSYSTPLLKDSLVKSDQDMKEGFPLAGLIHNRRFVYLNKYLENYLSHFDPNYLFMKGDDARHHAPRMGVVYLICLPFILIGLYQLLKKRSADSAIILFWLAISPLASSIAIDSPNASRSLVMMPAVIIMGSLGLTTVYYNFNSKKRLALFSAISLLYIINIIFYINNYFVFTNKFHKLYWQYGYKEAIESTRDYKKVFFLNNIDQGYMFYLFYEKYNPEKYLAFGGSTIRDDACYAIQSRYFGHCDKKIRKGDVYVTTAQPIKSRDRLLKEILVDEMNTISIFRAK